MEDTYYQIVKCLHGLLDRRLIVESVYSNSFSVSAFCSRWEGILQNIYVVRVQSLQRSADLVEDGSSGEVIFIDIVLRLLERLSENESAGLRLLTDTPIALGHDDDLLAWDIVLL